MNASSSKGLRSLAVLVASLILFPVSARAVFERVGPVDPRWGYPAWYQDRSGLALDFCTPETQYELDNGYCLILPPVPITTAPEVFPTNFSDEHFYWAGDALGDMVLNGANGGKARLVQALEGAFATGPVVAGEQIVFGRLRFDLRDLPFDGTYIIYTPFGVRTFPGQVGGVKTRLFYTEDIGLSCNLGDFTCALQAGVGPFLLPSAAVGGLELPPFSDPNLPGQLYIADPARVGPVTGSTQAPYVTFSGTVDPNRFRIDVDRGPANGGLVTVLDVVDFTLMGRIHQQPIPSRVAVDRASYARTAAGALDVDVYATGESTLAPRLPGSAPSTREFPQLAYYDAPCSGAPDPANPGGVLPPYTAPAGTPTALVRFGTSYYGASAPAALPPKVCLVNLNARTAGGAVVPHYDPAPLGDQVSIARAIFDPTGGGSLSVQASSSDEFLPPELAVGAFGDLAGNAVLSGGLAFITPAPAVPSKIRVISQEGGAAELQVVVGARAASGVTLAPDRASPQVQGAAVVFTAQGAGAASYLYRFLLDGVVVQGWSPTNTWVLPAGSAPKIYQVQAQVWAGLQPTPPDASSAAVSYEIVAPKATAVSLQADPTMPSPHVMIPGQPVLFTAAATGPAGATMYYKFSLSTAGGPFAMVQDWSTANTWSLPDTALPATYSVLVEASGRATGPRDVFRSVSYVVAAGAATGLTLAVDPTMPSPHVMTSGQPVPFTATGTGPAGVTLYYRFSLSTAGGPFVETRAWSTVATWALPDTTPANTYTIMAEVSSKPAGPRDLFKTAGYTVLPQPATAVTLAADATMPSPHVMTVGQPVPFNAAATIPAGTTAYYRFYLNSGAGYVLKQDWSTSATWTMPDTTPAGTHTVLVEASTRPTGPRDVFTTLSYQVKLPLATGVLLAPDATMPTPHVMVPGQPVPFNATGQGVAGAVFYYRFFVNDGTGYVEKQTWSTSATYLLPDTSPPGLYQVLVEVRTNTFGARDAYALVGYNVVP